MEYKYTHTIHNYLFLFFQNKYQQDIYDISMNGIITESKCGTDHIWHLCGIPLVGRSCAL